MTYAGSDATANTIAKAQETRRHLLSLLDDSIQESDLQLNDHSASALIWNGETLDDEKIVHPRTAMEIVWELTERNFWLELTALDDYLCNTEGSNDSSPRYLAILRCCAGMPQFVLAPEVA